MAFYAHGRGKEAVSSTTEIKDFLSHKPRPAQRAGEIRKFPCSNGRTRARQGSCKFDDGNRRFPVSQTAPGAASR